MGQEEGWGRRRKRRGGGGGEGSAGGEEERWRRRWRRVRGRGPATVGDTGEGSKVQMCNVMAELRPLTPGSAHFFFSFSSPSEVSRSSRSLNGMRRWVCVCVCGVWGSKVAGVDDGEV